MKSKQNVTSFKQNKNSPLADEESNRKSTIIREKIEFNPDNSKSYGHKQTLSNDKSINNIIDRNNNIEDDMKLNKKGHEELDIDKKSVNIDDKILNKNPSQLFVSLMRLFYSRNCINLYIALITVSTIIFIYSLISYFKKWDEYPILIAEIVLFTIFLFDLSVRIYINGCKKYFKLWINWLDFLLIICSGVTILMYANFNDVAKKVENISFSLLIFVRNFSQLLRLIILLRNQNQVRKNIEEIIHFTTELNERKLENLGLKNKNDNPVLSFMDGRVSAKNSHKNIRFENLKDNEFNL